MVAPQATSLCGRPVALHVRLKHETNCTRRLKSLCSLLFGEFLPTDLVKATCAPFGGLIALYPAALSAAVTPVPELSAITITSPGAGHRVRVAMQQVLGGERGSLVAVGWAAPELLVCVTSTGLCLVFTAHGALRALDKTLASVPRRSSPR